MLLSIDVETPADLDILMLGNAYGKNNNLRLKYSTI